MVKVITYGTFDLLHYGHIRLLERAKALGDWLIVGVTADDFDKTRGKINVQQPLMERIEAVRGTGLADEIIVEEYEGQKIDDIRRMGIDIFTVGSDWEGTFDYLRDYCQVVYLPRTQGVSSSEIREQRRGLTLGLVGESAFLNKVAREAALVNGLKLGGICTRSAGAFGRAAEGLSGAGAPEEMLKALPLVTDDFETLLEAVDAVYIRSLPSEHADQIRMALEKGKHVLCESPLTLDPASRDELTALAAQKGLILMDALKTAYATAYARLLLLIKSGRIGEVVSVDATCTSLAHGEELQIKMAGRDQASSEQAGSNQADRAETIQAEWDSIHEWGPTALLPIFQILGTGYTSKHIAVRYADPEKLHESFVKADFVYPHAVASMKIGNGVKSEGELVVSGTKGYVYVPAPWWKTDYFELRYEDPQDNKRYFYQLDGEGIRYELVAFARAVETGRDPGLIGEDVSRAITGLMADYTLGADVIEI